MNPFENAPPTARPKQAIVLSGGGAHGAYEVGILKALFSGKAKNVGLVDPAMFFGTSIGSYNASFLVSKWEQYGPAAVGNLERAWLEVMAGAAGRNGGYRFRADPIYLLNPASYLPNPLQPLLSLGGDSAFLGWEAIRRAVYLVSASGEGTLERVANLFNFPTLISNEPWLETIRTTIDFAAIRRSQSRKLRIFGTNWATGILRVFKNEDMTDKLGPLAVLASSAIPGVFPVVNVGAEPYVDGGVLMNTPLRPALEEGADVIHVVYLDPDVASIPLSALDSSVASSYRLQTISWAALVNSELDRARRINRGLAVFKRLQRGESIEGSESELETLTKGALMVLGGKHRTTYRPVTIHRHAPDEELGSGALGMLNLKRDHLESLIEKGFADASYHDCERECCVIPDESLTASAPGEEPR